MLQGFQAEDYSDYFQSDFRHRWLRPQHIEKKLATISGDGSLDEIPLGKSVQGRDILAYKWGRGETRILAWSQMHGNEPTATMALIDLFKFLTSDDQYNDYRKQLASDLSIMFIPMLNPDGAEAFTRINALNVDLNRDAASARMPEMMIMHKLVEEFKPDWGFNLHDQRSIFSAGNTGNPATISFLSPSSEVSKKMTPTREKAMKLIVLMVGEIEKHIPNQIGRYNDDFYPRAVGEYFHQKNIPCILIESGASHNDYFRDTARKMNFMGLLRAFEAIADGSFENLEWDKYLAIPNNQTNIYDLIIRNCNLQFQERSFQADIALQIKEMPDLENYTLRKVFYISEIGDLSFHYGLNEINGGTVTFEQEMKPESTANFKVVQNDKIVIQFQKGEMME